MPAEVFSAHTSKHKMSCVRAMESDNPPKLSTDL